jgi:hypothetical protein
MCLECGFYNGRQVMDMTAKKEKREARMRAKAERIRTESVEPAPETTEVSESVSTEDNSKEAREENNTDKRPEKKPE